MRALAATAAILLLALCASKPALGAEFFDDLAARALEGFPRAVKNDCAVKQVGALRFALVDNALLTTVSDDERSFLLKALERALSSVGAVNVPLRNRGEFTDIVTDMLRGDGIAPRRIEEAQRTVDVLVTLDASERDAAGRPIIRAVATAVDMSCRLSSRGLPLRGFERAFDVPDAFFKVAGIDLLRRDERAEEVLVMPAKTGNGIINNRAVDDLQRSLASGLQQSAQYRVIRPEGPFALNVIPYIGGRRHSDSAWQATLKLDRRAGGIDLTLEFRHPPTGRVFTHSAWIAPGDFRTSDGDQILRVAAAKEEFKKGDAFDVRIELRQRRRLFCFILSPDGEATLLYPTRENLRFRDNVFDAQKELKFPQDFRSFKFALQTKMHEFFHCVSTPPQQLPESVLKLWLDNTFDVLAPRNGTGATTVDMTNRILSSLRDGVDRTESFADIIVVE